MGRGLFLEILLSCLFKLYGVLFALLFLLFGLIILFRYLSSLFLTILFILLRRSCPKLIFQYFCYLTTFLIHFTLIKRTAFFIERLLSLLTIHLILIFILIIYNLRNNWLIFATILRFLLNLMIISLIILLSNTIFYLHFLFTLFLFFL
jgi:hypothetical protein